MEDQEVIQGRSAQELFEELDAMEAKLPTGFNDLIKKQKVPVLKDVETVEDKPATLSSEDSGTVGLSSDELTHSLAKDPNETPH